MNTVKDIAFLRSDNKATIPNEYKSFFTIESQIGSAGSNGYMELTIIDVTNQGNNKDNTPANVMSTNYTYECKVNIRDESVQPNSKATKLIVYGKSIPALVRAILLDHYTVFQNIPDLTRGYVYLVCLPWWY